MAQKVLVQLIDDLDQSVANETVRFMLDGVEYEIDLSEANAAKLREHLGRFTQAGRKLTGRRGVKPRRTGKSNAVGADISGKIREWAKGAGFDIKPIGRLSYEVVQAYEAAHPK